VLARIAAEVSTGSKLAKAAHRGAVSRRQASFWVDWMLGLNRYPTE
jgi:hypothetical protein